MDTLALLREYYRDHKLDQVVILDDSVNFGNNYTFPRTKRTAYKSEKGKGEFYALDTVVFFLQNHEEPTAQYLAKASQAGTKTVHFLDRKDLIAYLTGAESSSDYIIISDELLREDEAEPIAKRQRTDGTDSTVESIKSRLAAQERQLRDRNSMLIVPGKSFQGVLTLLQELADGGGKKGSSSRTPVKGPAVAGSGKGISGKGSTPAAANGATGSHSSGARHYTILLPPGTGALLNMYNAQEFFEHGRFRSQEECQKGGAHKVSTVDVVRRGVDGRPDVRYTLTDRPPRKEDRKQWSDVAAVVVNGKTWQFKDFPAKGAAKGDLVETFHRMLGVFFHFHDESVPAAIKQWNVKTMALHRNDRHKDITVQVAFFRHLEQFINARHSR